MAMFRSKPWWLQNLCGVSWVLSYSAASPIPTITSTPSASTGTTTEVSSSSFSSTGTGNGILYERISRAGNPRISMIDILEQWLDEGYSVKQEELRFLISRLRTFRRFTHALQVSEWMDAARSMNFSRRDFAVHLDLVFKVHGVNRAEEYFETIPCYMRAPQSYGALLNCYAYTRSVEKAEAIMQKFMEFRFDKRPFPYNSMLKLYFHLRRYDEMDRILRQMEEKGVSFDYLTYGIRLNAYVVAGDVRGIESFLMKMEADPSYLLTWQDCVIVANGYIKAGLLDKAMIMLNRAEQLSHCTSKKLAYRNFLTMYARSKSKDDVYRLWDAYKGSFVVHNKGYVCMVSSLIILGDLEGAEVIVDDTLSRSKDPGFFATNLLLRAYCEMGEVEKGEALVKRAVNHGKEPPASTWQIIATGYCKHGEMAAATKAMKKVISAGNPDHRLDKMTLLACQHYLRLKEDPKELEEFMGLLADTRCSFEKSSSNHFNKKNVRSDVDDLIQQDQIQ